MKLSPTARMMQADDALCRAFGKRPGERLVDAAHRALANAGTTPPTRRAAEKLLSIEDSWTAMFAAEEALRTPIVVRRCGECLRQGARVGSRGPYPAVIGDLCALHGGKARLQP